MKITFIGATHEVTGSCYYLEAAGKKFLVDCGMEQGPDLYENQEIPVASGDIDYILLTHAHIDHSGKIPMLCKQGFHGEIVTTFATSDLCNIMLIFKSLRRNGGIVKQGEAADRNMSRSIQWRMPMRRSNCWHRVIMIKELHCVTE